MQWPDALAAQARRVQPLLLLIALATLQLVVMLALAHSGGWSYSAGEALLGGALVTIELCVLCAVACTIGGRLLGFGAGVVWVLAPPLMVRYFISGGFPLVDFGVVFHERVLPYAYGLQAPEAVAAGSLLLASAWLALTPAARGRAGDAGAGAAAGAAVAAAVLLHPFMWPALAAVAVRRAARASARPVPAT